MADVLAKRYAARLQALRSRAARGLADVADVRIGGRPVTLAIPRAFMNESGAPVAAVRSYYRVDVARLVIVHDELDIDFGRLRLKRGGGEGGHNGLRSVSQALGSQDYYRVRMGIGRPPGRQDPADYVLHDFGAAERRELPPVLERAADAVEALIDSGLEAAQQSFNS